MEAEINFKIAPPHVNEDIDPALTPSENARIIALRKADAVANSYRDNPTLAADTFVVLHGEILGKPLDENDAKKMLSKMSGQEHTVITGVALVHVSRDIRFSHVEESKVRFKQINMRSIENYVATGEPLDKAGAYAIQGGAAKWIAGYTGSLTNIIGLPMEPLQKAFKEFGYDFRKEEMGKCRS